VGVRADTTRDDQVRAAVAEAVRLLGGAIDILVNAAAEPAGFAGPPKLAGITGEFFHAEMDTKVMGYLRCAREVAPAMQAQGWGRIVNISGLAARQTGNAVGSMRNVAVAALTKNLADELGPHGINVTVVHPETPAPSALRRWWPHARRRRACRRKRWKHRWQPPTRSTTWSTPARWRRWWRSCARPSRAPSTATPSPWAAARRAASTTRARCHGLNRAAVQERPSLSLRLQIRPPDDVGALAG
jgi:NAD(P)-dependent dehydrogenase (short-subunit alcohol dehydrogenase family)